MVLLERVSIFLCLKCLCDAFSRHAKGRGGGSGFIRLNDPKRQQKDHTFLVNYLSVVTTQKSSRKGDDTTRKK